MDGRLLAITVLLCHAHCLLARSLVVPRAVSSETIKDWIVYIERNSSDHCAGVQVSNEWVLTLGDCVQKDNFWKYQVAFQNSTVRNISTERRSPLNELLVLLQIDVDSETDKGFSALATAAVPAKYGFKTYNWDIADAITGHNVDFVGKKSCTKRGVLGDFRKNRHTCFKTTIDQSVACVPGFPVFGTKKNKVILQGLSTTKSGFCSDKFQASVAIEPHQRWIEKLLTDCGDPPSINNGLVQLDEPFYSTFESTASVTCDKGYEPSPFSVTCQKTGDWETAMCNAVDCGSLPKIKKGVATLDDPSASTFGATASINCKPGYESNKPSITCRANRTWQSAKCTIKDCGTTPSVSNGTVSLTSSTTTYRSTATVNCDPGYDSNQASIACQASGSWETPTCTIKDCGSVPSLSDGTVSLTSSTSTYGSTATVTCDPGYASNQASIDCQASGSWETPTCTIKDCGSLPSVSDGTVSLTSTTTTYGSNATVNCDPGYDSNKASIACQASGSWETPTCIIRDCGSVPSVSDGTVSLTATTTTYGSTANVTCNSGYDSNQASIACQAGGSWETPTCTIKDCGSVPSLSDGTVNLTSTTTTYGSNATVNCDPGYDSNQASIACHASGSWETPTCTIKDCGSVPSVSDGTVSLISTSTTYGSIANVTCDSGYDSNQASISCKASGSWETPTCTIKDCGSVPSLSDGTVSLTSTTTTYGSNATVNCDPGYESNLALIACQASGSWEIATCTIKDCGSVPSVSDGTVSLISTTTTYGSIANVTCDPGYDSNQASIACQASGSWETPTCSIKDCGSVPSLSDGTVSLTSTTTTYGSNATVNCDPGHDSNQAVIACHASGSWETPTCTIKDCGSVPSVSDGTVSLISTTTTYGSTANVTCDPGYNSNQVSIACQTSGSWETPTCTIKDCGSVPSLSDGTVSLTSTTSTYGSNATVNCDPGYDSNQAVISCQASGSWETPTCTIKDCGSVPSVSDGTVNLISTTTTYGSNATVTCAPGYDSNQASIVCQLNGSWETPTCSIKDCGSVPSVSDGTVSLISTTTTYGSTAKVTCDSGYDSNQTSIACQASGSWEKQNCTIKDCGSVPSLSDGTVSLTSTTTTYGSNATVNCDPGYDSNQASIACQASGSWETPTCTIKDCGSVPSVSDGTVSVISTTTTYGSTANVTCDPGYDSNQASISCQASGSWETPTCTIKDCGSVPSLSDGTVSLTSTTTTYGSNATVNCDPGYDSNQASIVCQASGSWETPTCTIKDCGSVPSLSDGTVSLTSTTTTYGSNATVNCDPGYDSNQASIICQASASWETPTCTIKDCGSVPSLSDGTVSLFSTTTTYGSTANVTCDNGYDSNQASIVCQASGSWETPTCTIKDCGSVPSLSDGTVSLASTTTTYGSNATVNCDPGYDSNQETIACQASGSWETPTCTIKDCGSVPSVSDGTVSLIATTTTYGSTANVTCDSGYDSNPASIACQASGSWETPICTIKDCGSVPSLSGGTVSLTSTTTTYGSTATVNCDPGYDSNQASIACQANGSWETPTCTIKDCGSVPSVSDGTVSLTGTSTTYGSNATVNCDSGYGSNKASIACQASGSWETPTCTIKDCGSVPSVSDGTVSLTSTNTTYGSNAAVSCDTGYDSNQATITCQASGSWETPTCTIRDCGTPSVTNGNVTLDSTLSTVGSTASVTCNKGFDANKDSINCKNGGNWQNAKCIIRDCGSVPSVSDGTVSLISTTTTYGSTANVTCDPGYDSNQASISCQASGSWETPTCTITDCGSVPSVSDGTVSLTSTTTTYGSNSTVSCDTGYYSNQATITCQASGSWETPTCTIRDCGTPSVSNGNVTLDSTLSTVGSTASVTCNKGYDANKDSIRCKDGGNWQNAKCTIRDCGSTLPSVSNGAVALDDTSSTTVGSTATVTCSEGFSTTKTTLVCKTNGSWSTTSCT